MPPEVRQHAGPELRWLARCLVLRIWQGFGKCLVPGVSIGRLALAGNRSFILVSVAFALPLPAVGRLGGASRLTTVPGFVCPGAPLREAHVATTEAREVPQAPPVSAIAPAPGLAEPDNAPVELTPEQLARLNRVSLQLLLRSVVAQALGTLLVSVLAWWVGGSAAGLSALAGALACTIPNTLFALRLVLAAVGIGKGSPVTFFLGEFLKLGATAALLVLVVRLAQDALVWPALIAGVIVALKSHYSLLLFKNS